MSEFLAKAHGAKPALLALCVVAALVFIMLSLPVYAMFSAQSRARLDMLEELALTRARLAQGPQLARELEALQNTAQSAPGLLKSKSADLAAAEIQSTVKTIAAANAAEVRSALNMPTIKTNGFETIAVGYDLTVPLSHLSALIYAVESRAPYLFVDNVQIVAPPEAPASGTADPVLEVHWTVFGYRWAGRK